MEVIEEQKELARNRWPAATRRSSVTNDRPDEKKGPEAFTDYEADYGRTAKVDRLHG